jgi:hypothetical protein
MNATQPMLPAAADRRRRVPDWVVCTLVFVVMLGGAITSNYPEPQPQVAKFGWEYGDTAAALATGHGFSNPFEGVESGPTAWMPPGYVILIAGVFFVFGVKSVASMWVLLVLKYAGLAVALGWLLRLADASGLGRYRWWMLLAFLGPMHLNRYTTFLALHDPWLHLLLSCALLLAWVRESGRPIAHRPALMVLAVVLPLASPSVAAAFVALVGFRALRDLRSGSGLVAAVAPGLVRMSLFGASAGIWTVRNFVEFRTFIPVKSNLWFDFVQANELDDDGLVTNETFLLFNPSNNNDYQRHYAAVGESAFTVEYNARAVDLMARDPGEVVRRVGRRAWSAFVFLQNDDDVPAVDPAAFADGELEAARAAGLVIIDWLDGWRWVCLSWPEERVEAAVRSFAPDDPKPILRDWRRARADIRRLATNWRKVAQTLAITAIPTLFLIAGWLQRSVRRNPVFATAAVIYVVHLAPYVLVSHYLRYQTPMIGIQAVFSFFAATSVLEAWRQAARQKDDVRVQAPSAVPGSPQT